LSTEGDPLSWTRSDQIRGLPVLLAGLVFATCFVSSDASAGIDLLERERRARTALASVEAETEELLRVAHEYWRRGDAGKSLSLFEEVARRRPEPDRVKLDALRMVGQTNLFGLQDYDAAASAYSAMLECLDKSDAGGPAQRSFYRTEGLMKLAAAYQAQGEYAMAAGVRERALREGDVTGDRRAVAILENARDHAKLQQYDEAVRHYDRLFDEFPGFGRDNGRFIDVRLEQIRAATPDSLSPERLQALLRLWDEPANRGCLRAFNVGRQIVYLADHNDERDIMLSVGKEVLQGLEEALPGTSEDDLRKYRLDNAYAQVTIVLAEWYESQREVLPAIALYRRLLKAFPEGAFAQLARSALDRLSARRFGTDPDEMVLEDVSDLVQTAEQQPADAPVRQEQPPVASAQHGNLPPAATAGSSRGSGNSHSDWWLAGGIAAALASTGIVILRILRRRTVSDT